MKRCPQCRIYHEPDKPYPVGPLIIYEIPADTLVSVCPDDENRFWEAHTTRHVNRFTHYRHTDSGAVVFEAHGWLLLTRWNKVRKLKNRQPQGP